MWRRLLWRLLAIWGLVFIAYSNSFHWALVFDNASVIGEGPRIREATPQKIHSTLRGRYWYDDSPRATAPNITGRIPACRTHYAEAADRRGLAGQVGILRPIVNRPGRQ
jgi:hypothetical protein